jgi:ATP-binding cassette subfamily C (CFTR/MRP) protein 10
MILKLSNKEREQEVHYLSVRKYLDACCVFLWATTPTLVPFLTFTTSVLIGNRLTAANVSQTYLIP